jgi:hypothetical protein
MPVSAPPQLDSAQLQELSLAQMRGKRIRRAASIAIMDGWVTAIFAAFSLMSGLFSIVGLLVGIGMSVVAYIEFSGARKLRSLDERAAKMLGWNQIGFAILLTAYACWGLYSTHTNPGRYKELIGSDPQLEQMLGPIEEIVKLMAMLVYGSLIAVAVFVQGGTAWFYFSRAKHVRAYVAETPEWILAMQRAGIRIW